MRNTFIVPNRGFAAWFVLDFCSVADTYCREAKRPQWQVDYT